MKGIKYIWDEPSMDGSEGVLAVVIRHGVEIPEGVGFLNEERDGLQLGVMRRPAGYVVESHRHVGMHPQVEGTQEVLMVLSGRVRVSISSSQGEGRGLVELGPGDVIALLRGGHGVEFLEESRLVEIKQGPWAGGKDKVML